MVAKVGGEHDADGALYERLRKSVLRDPAIPGALVPAVLRNHRDFDHLWSFAKSFHSSWEPRRRHVRDEFARLLGYLEESESLSPSDAGVSMALMSFDEEGVSAAWQKALSRRASDPAGAITAARTLLETVLKHVLDDARVDYAETDDLPRLYRRVAERLNLAPSQHVEPVFKQVLGGCTAVVEGLGSVRNKVGDAHGAGRRPVNVSERHAHLVVNLAGAMATFVVETWRERQPDMAEMARVD
ncbi:abortive infection family protein [uncultured Brevundimonas sp.]|uniref:abortive infection family protein n=1 Tax=uncultured Brevundimonas sp. TaxID=213418 RepID=UPI00260F0225|nr:abortive infection family protein [uncultured Brevundimonas sp.]